MVRLASALALLAGVLGAQTTTAELARRISESGLDPDACYHVRDLHFTRGDITFYFNDGYLIFGKAVDGARLSAVFSAETEGDAEVLLLPPSRSERLSLAAATQAPNLNEHFRDALMLFTDDSAAVLEASIRQRKESEKSPERGLLLSDRWADTFRNFSRSFQVRLVRDLLSENRAQTGFFYAAVSGVRVGNFDLMFDPRSTQQITVGKVGFRNERAYFDTWTRFEARAFRQRRRLVPPLDLTIPSYHIEATLEPDLKLRVITRARVVPGPNAVRVLGFDISAEMRITEAKVNGTPAEVFQPDSMRSTLIRGTSNDTFLVVPPKPLTAGREIEVEFHHEGYVITDAGNRVYFVGARGAWYPNLFSHFSRFEMVFRHPTSLDLVATGDLVSSRTEGDQRVAQYRTDVPVRMAGFNLGQYDHQSATRAGYTVQVYANRQVETALAPRRRIVVTPQSSTPAAPPRWTVDLQPMAIEVASPTERLQQLADETANALEYMASYFGPPVLKHLTVAPIPGTFGQGFPGLIYLSTLAYLAPPQRPGFAADESAQTFYSEILHAHETAHQWWGNVVTAASEHDEWLMEGLANYSALLYLEKRKGTRALDAVLETYRANLLAKTESGQTIESAGPIIWGNRLITSQTPQAWRVITYEKGSWIIHMLRRRIGDERFLEMLGQLRARYQNQTVTTEQFRALAAEFLPKGSPDPKLEGFFEQFVYSTGIPALKLSYHVRGSAPQIRVTGTVSQSDVDPDFSAFVPIEIQFAKGRPAVYWVRTSSDPTPFSITLRQPPARVLLDPVGALLKR